MTVKTENAVKVPFGARAGRLTIGIIEAFVCAIDYADASGTLVDVNGKTVTIPANSIVLNRRIFRTTAWDALTTFTVGKSGDTDWLVDNTQHNLTGAAADVETVADPKVVTTATDVTATWDQGAATEGAGFLVIEFLKCADG